MAYVAVAKALYEYTAQDPETELSFKEDQIFYIIEKEDDEWWKGKAKDDSGAMDGEVGLIPANYVEEIPAVNTTRAMFAYDSTSPEELSMPDDALLQVFAIEEEWLLVQVDGSSDTNLGFVPRNYCEPLDSSAEVEVADAADAAAEVEAQRHAEREKEIAEKQRQLKLKDKVETWSISELDGKKKKKGTLGVGNAAVFFASDTDKSAPVKQYPITALTSVAQTSSKTLSLSFSTLREPLQFHCGGSDTTKAILAKLESSKAAAGEALELLSESQAGAASSGDEREDEPAPVAATSAPAAQPRGVRFAPSPSSQPTATVQYDFDADGDDELTVKDGEIVTVLDKENDEWWLVKNSRGKEGVVPAAYVQLNDGSAPAAQSEEAPDSDDEREREAEAAANLQAERSRQAEAAEEERRRIQAAAEARRDQEEEDRRLALQIEEEQKERAARKAMRRQEEERRRREADAQAARENARAGGLQPPKITKRPSNNDVAAAANRLPTRGHNAPVRPPENNRPKPNPQKIRTWSDKSGQFNVEAEYLGLNGNKIRLHKLNGVIIEVPLDKMSSRDAELIRRHEAKKQQRALPDEDDVPLGQSNGRGAPSRSFETTRRSAPVDEPIPAEAMRAPPPRKPRFDWFEFFLSAGCDMDDCTRYATNFERDRIDEAILPDLEAGTLRSLGLREGDVIRVRKAISNKFAKKTPEQQAQIDLDAEYARQLQEHENSGSKGPAPVPPPGLFTGPDGKLANNTRRGRPEKKNTGPETVDAAAIAAASNQLSKTSIAPPIAPTPPPPPPAAASPPPAEEKEKKPAALISGFDDDAWTIKPSSKPASPAPTAATSSPAANIPASTTDSLLAQINALRPASTGLSQNNTGGSFDRVSQMVGQPRAPVQQVQQSPNIGQNYGLGVQNTGQPMGQMYAQQTGFQQQQQQPNLNGARGPLAPVPSNQGLLNPMQPQATGMFIPTRGLSPLGQQQTGFQPQGMMAQPTGMMPQPTGYQAGFQQGYGGQPQQVGLQPNFTGYPGGMQQPPQQSSFNAVASMQQQPQQSQQQGDKFAPSNIFAAMKKTEFGKPEEQQPQNANKYDSLRPLTTGYNGAPGMMPQPTGMMMPQQTGMMPQQQTGMMMGGGMMPQMTGYNPMMGYQQQGQQQNPYGYR
ncbi:hypothetical protein CI109_105624 [Kwoniella shandongensis]|uniref:Actin cytoskeleton-regulatory complex protein SLA1 n=1 Tax=Kwoniella shandongensis TaxID=1734106 RepID=A0A5M6C2R6_9TREE|nr:uncharacterized protein CI109_002340 [Kwoniella shandongensis]KAA5529447.1 hypothetical protein CI109_002340 [Kwoniella shandongensis]